MMSSGRYRFRGKSIDTLTREELIEALEQALLQVENLQSTRAESNASVVFREVLKRKTSTTLDLSTRSS